MIGTNKMAAWAIAGGLGLAALSIHAGEELSAAEFLTRSQQKYASLSSYADSGNIATQTESGKIQTGTFKIRLARPNLYSIEWEQSMSVQTGMATNRNVIWSGGDGERCMLAGFTKYYKLPENLKARTLYSPMPEMFFTAPEGGGLWRLSTKPFELISNDDEQVDGVRCRVLKGKLNDAAVTLWIGRDDLLIHRIQRIKEGEPASRPIPEITDSMIADALRREKQPMTPEAATRMKQRLQESAVRAQTLDRRAGRRTTTETHEKISVNGTFAATAFVYPVPAEVPFSETFP